MIHTSQNILFGTLKGFKADTSLEETIIQIVEVIAEGCFVGGRCDVKLNQEILSNTVSLVDANCGATIKEIELFQRVSHSVNSQLKKRQIIRDRKVSHQ